MLDPRLNPYNPGAGARPPEMAGRRDLVDEFDIVLDRVEAGRHDRSKLLIGLRGVGKTVLLNSFQDQAVAKGWQTAHIEASRDRTFDVQLLHSIRSMVLSLSRGRRVSARAKKMLGVLHSFALTLPDGLGFSFDVAKISGRADSGSLQSDLLDVFEELGAFLKGHHVGALFVVDEAHHIRVDHFESLIVGLHRAASQLGLPIVFALAGLPNLPELSKDAKTYSERLFLTHQLGKLDEVAAAEALIRPASELNVTFDELAAEYVVAQTEGYAYFLQEYGKFAWNLGQGSSITLEDAKNAHDQVIRHLDSSFFGDRVMVTTDAGRVYLRAMASLGKGPHGSGEIAAAAGRKVSALSKVRDRLRDENLIWFPEYGKADFTVPQFDSFIRRYFGGE